MRIKLFVSLFVLAVVFSISVKQSSYSKQEMGQRDQKLVTQGKVLGVNEENKPNDQMVKEPEIVWPKKPTKINENAQIDVNAVSGLVMDCSTGEILVEKNADTVLPIASQTKLITAMIFLEHNPGWDKTYQIKDRDVRGGGKSYIYSGETLFVRDIFKLMLIASENTAAMSLAHSTGLTDKEFAKAMNDKVKELGLEKTRFIEPVGLDNENVSTARELAVIVKHALENDFIHQATILSDYHFKTIGGRAGTIIATNKLLGRKAGDIKVEGGKTGHINDSGYCFSGKFTNKQGKEVISVVLGSESDGARFSVTNKMIDWVYKNFSWK